MNTATVTTKGQFTLNKQLLGHLGARNGDKLSIKCLSDKRIEISVQPERTEFASFRGILRDKLKNAPYLTDEQMSDAIADGYVARGLSGMTA